MEYPKLPIHGSVDLDGKPFNVSDENVRYTQNLIPDKMGNPVRRGSLLFEAALCSPVAGRSPSDAPIHVTFPIGAASSVAAGGSPIWMGAPNLGSSRYIVATVSDASRLDFAVSNGSKEGYDTVAINARDTQPTLLPSMFVMANLTYLVYGRNPWGSAGLIMTPDLISPSGFTWSELVFAGSGNADFQPDMACEYKGRIVYGLEDGRIVWSDRYQPTVIGNSALQDRSLSMKTLETGKLVALHPVMLDGSGSLATSGLLAVFQFGCKLILGEPLQTTESGLIFGTLQVNNLSNAAGCVSGNAIVDTNWGTIWVGHDDVWIMPFGSVPVPIGRHIKPLLKAQPQNLRYRIHAVLHDGFLRVALFSDGQGPTDTSPLGEQWWLDLRDGPPEDWTKARWFGPQIFKCATFPEAFSDRGVDDRTIQGTYFMMKDPREGRNSRIYGVSVSLVPNLAGTTAEMLTLLTYDNPSVRDIVGYFASSLIPWTTLTAMNIGDEIIVLIAGQRRPFLYKVTAAGNTGAVEPVWTGAAGNIVDAGVTWTNQGPMMGAIDVFGSEILCRWDSKEYDFGTRMTSKLFNGMEINIYNSAPETIRFKQIIDGGRSSSQVDKYLDESSGPLLGVDQIKLAAAFAEEYKSVSARPDEGTRKNGNSVQYRVQEVAGIVVPLAYQNICIVDAGNRTVYRAPVPQTYYSGLSELIEMLITVLTGGLGPNAITNQFGVIWGATYKTSAKVTINGSGLALWAPPSSSINIGTKADRYIWGLLGFTSSAYLPAASQVSNDMPFDLLVGLGLGFDEATAAFHPFGRRPQ